MSWIILIVAGLLEVCFAFCLGKTKETVGNEYYLWGIGFVVSVTLSMYLLAKATQTLPYGPVSELSVRCWSGFFFFMNRLLWDGCFLLRL